MVTTTVDAAGGPMGRKERPLDAASGPVEAFAAELRKLRGAAGNPPYASMAKSVHVSRTVLSEAAGGRQPPTWPTVKAYLSALGVVEAREQNEWHERWSSMRAAYAGQAGEPAATPSEPPDPSASGEVGDRPNDRPRPSHRRRLILIIGGAVTVSAAVIMFATLRSGDARTMPPPKPGGSPPGLVGVVVSNKVAVGRDALIEDSTPAYLSTEPAPYCARRGCQIAGTEMWSGAVLYVTCIVDGAWMTNYDLDSDVGKTNPNRYSSSRWYKGATSGENTAGYLSEVYIAPEYRGGLGLPVCGNAAHPTASGTTSPDRPPTQDHR